jgi:hypothetical protein
MVANLFIFNSKYSMSKYSLRKNSYAYFFLKLGILALIVFILDFIIGNTLSYFYFKQQSGLQYCATYAIDKTKEDILIFGSSRASHHYRPDIFEKKLGVSTYNVGRDGQAIFYHTAVLRAVLKRYQPKMIILDFNSKDIRKDGSGYDPLTALLPYCKHHPEIRNIVQLRGAFEKWKLCSAIYPYNSSIFTIAVGNAEFNKKRRIDIKGYTTLQNNWKEPIDTFDESGDFVIDSVKLNTFESFIKDCKANKIKLYLISSPYFYTSIHPDPYIIKGKEIAKKYGIVFFDYSQDSTFMKDGSLFFNVTHLNDKGAQVFSELVTDRILGEKNVDQIMYVK